MPELLEVETYRRHVADLVGSMITGIDVPDPDYLRGGSERDLRNLLLETRITRVDRHGKVLIVEIGAAVLGLRFGMTGIPIVDDEPAIEALEYSSSRRDPAWARFRMKFRDRELEINDPRRLGSVTLEPDLSKLGPDAWTIDAASLGAILGRTRVAVKAALLDQARVAGLGNLLADELLWRASIAPGRPACDLAEAEIGALATHLPSMLTELDERGGSTEGDHFPHRAEGARCPVDGEPMVKATIGGRTTWWCSGHQR